jgi:hypothetical protein
MNESQSELWRKRAKRVEFLREHLSTSEIAHMTDAEVRQAVRKIALEKETEE